MNGPKEAYQQAMANLVVGDSQRYAPHATTRKDYPTLTVRGGLSYAADRNELYLESIGPQGGGPYTLVFDLAAKQLTHAYGPYEDQQAPGIVEDIAFP